MLPLLLAIVLASGLISQTEAAGRLVINLKDNVAVASDKVLLKDVADLTGSNAHQVDMLAQITLGSAPAFGETVIQNQAQIRERLEAVAGKLPLNLFSGAPAVQIRLQGRQVTADEIEVLLKNHLMETTSWKESEIGVRLTGGLNGVELPPAGASLRIAPDSGFIGHRKVLAPVELLSAGKSLRSLWITAEITVRSEVLTAARKIPAGKIITPEDVSAKCIEITDLRATYIRLPEDIVGKISRRGIRSGDPLTRESFGEPMLVKSGETVRLRLEREGIVLTSLVKAEQDGKLGQKIRVRNIDFSTWLKAEVTGRAEVRVR